MKKILGDAKSIRSLLGGAKFAIDYYQREYRWEKKQITELLNDLSDKFLDNYDKSHKRGAVEDYGHYFLGSIIISEKEGQKFIIDGQQRLTSLTLLLIHIYHRLEQKSTIANLVFSERYGRPSFNLNVDERNDCMVALYRGESFEENNPPESVANILKRYKEIEDHFPDQIPADALPHFADWLIDNVYLVEITAESDADAYTIFETMNDRGLSLTPTDMLKGYLLANIDDIVRRNDASHTWLNLVEGLLNIGKEEDADAIKAWLRSQYAQTIRERKRGAKPRDFDLIGTEFHRWVRDSEKELGLRSSPDFANFIQEDFAFYGKWYKRVRQAAEELTKGLEEVYYNAWNNFTLQYPVLLAALARTDSETEILCKLRIVATYLDILIARRIWNFRSTSYSTMQYNMFQLVIMSIRRRSANEIAEILTERLEAEDESFTSNERFSRTGMNSPQIHRLLARITDFVETGAGEKSRYKEYMERSKNGYEVEHIWADHPERHEDEFDHPADFGEYRNRIGGLLLLPKSFNASFGDMPYEDKREHYFGQNLLAKSLHENAYKNNPGFKRFIDKTGLAFQPHAKFKKADMDARQSLYCRLAEQIWNPNKLRQIIECSESKEFGTK